MKKFVFGIVSSLVLAQAAVAGPTCTEQPKDEWMSVAAMQQKILADGYTIAKFKTTDGNCYEIYGYDAENRKVEVYFHPVTGEAVKVEID